MRGATARRTGLRVAHLWIVVLLCCVPPGAAAAGTEPGPVGVWPLSPTPRVVRGFDPPTTSWGSGHRGVDLAGAVGQAVSASVAGTVTFAGTIAGRPVVVVDAGETRTTYEPVSATVAVGTAVARGQRIGTLTSIASHCAPAACLHWGLIRNDDDVYLDPLTLVGAVRVRLLPLWRDTPATSVRPLAGASGAGSRPGVGLLERPAEPVGADVGVELRRGQGRVPQKLLD
ncbi:MAG: M23 family metallopeptidase [Nocardioides sp.]|uniref:M23 family metallopeptidase n=1 Tax=Nocardioides sp. TaxID=35761 RepID=UPI0039E5CC44